ncbi:MAG: hypothetical protein JWN41_1657, partial [Thermoleophilia bacterium]|nr:hypothetical protein [Thermoleophilia bacterium]
MGSTVTELETLERETRLVRTAFEVIHELDDDRRERCVKLGTSVLLAAAERVIECNAAHAGLEVLERFEAAPSDAIGKAAWVQVLGEVRERLHESAIAEPLDDTEQIATDDAATPMTESHAPLATVTSAEPEVSLHDHGQMI